MAYRYLIASGVGTDAVHFPDGRQMDNVPGGAGFHALTGLFVWSDSVLILSGVGPEYLTRHGAWYADNHCSTEGLIVRGDVTPRSHITYFEDGEREDKPDVGLDEFRKLDPEPSQIETWLSDQTRGVYTFKHLDGNYLDRLIALRKRYGFRLMWEISADAAIPENVEKIERYLPDIDIFSINKTEARTLYSTHNVDAALKRFCLKSPNWVYFRMGAEGACVIAQSRLHFAPSLGGLDVVDPTGCGNSSSAAVLCGMCEGVDPLTAGLMGSISAAYTLRQFGPPESITEQIRREARTTLDNLCAHVKDGKPIS